MALGSFLRPTGHPPLPDEGFAVMVVVVVVMMMIVVVVMRMRVTMIWEGIDETSGLDGKIKNIVDKRVDLRLFIEAAVLVWRAELHVKQSRFSLNG